MSGKEERDLANEAAPGPDLEDGPGAETSATTPVVASVRRSLKTPNLEKTLHGSAPSAEVLSRLPSQDDQPVSRPFVTALRNPLERDLGQGEKSEFIRIATPVTTRPELPAAVTALGGRPEVQPVGTTSKSGKKQAIDTESTHAPTPAPAVPSTHIPFRVGPYEVATRIAQGGMGSIYVCRRTDAPQAGGLFTLKVVRQHQAREGAAVQSFGREARVGALLHHPNAQTVLDTGVYDNQPFLILPYVEGASLGELLADDARPSASVVVTVLLDVLRALQHAHTVEDEKGQPGGLVHADVSPDNVLIGIDGIARLTDFGSARFTADDIAATPDAFRFGKASYMAPEQLRGEALDSRTDIFAVGVMMWTAMTGQKLFAGENYDQTVMRVMRKKVPPPSAFSAPPCLDDICLRALSRSPDLRYATADEMADALMTAAADTDLVASRADVAQWVRREVAEMLAERRRRIDSMFRDARTTPGAMATIPTLQPGTGPPPTRFSAPTIHMEGATVPAPTDFVPAPADSPRRPKTTLRQWYLIVSVSIAVFFATLIIASLALKHSSPHRRLPQNSSATPAASAAPLSPSLVPSSDAPR